MSLFSPSRCVLLLSDEGVNLYESGGGVKLLENIPWETEGFEEVLARAIKRKARGKSVLILNDMVEQHYRKERVPKASSFDKANMIKRRVSAAFPSYPIRSAIKLKEKPPVREDQDTSGDLYLFAAVPFSDNVRKSLGALQKSYASVAGFCLLPVESAGMVQALSKKLTRTGERAAKWTVFVGQHQGGGLRQIVTKNGELALTRMTPVVESDIDQELWSSEITNELKGTMSYLSRFGFEQSEGLDVIIIANNSVAEKITAKVDFDCNLNVLTCFEAANYLGVRVGRQEEQRFADPLHVAWAARKTSFTMPLQAAQLDKIAGPKKMVAAASALLLVGTCYYAYAGFEKGNEWMKNRDEIAAAKVQVEGLRQEHAAEVQKKKEAGFDFVLVDSATRKYGELETMTMKPLSLLETIGKALGPDISLTALDVRETSASELKTPEPDPNADPNVTPPSAQAKEKIFDVTLKIVFPAALPPEKGVALIGALQQRLKTALPNHEVSILKQVADLSYTGNFVGEATDQVNPNKEKQDYEAQILIRGYII